MQDIRSPNPPVVTGICDPNESPARHHCSLKLGSKLKYLKKPIPEKKFKKCQKRLHNVSGVFNLSDL